MKTKINDGGPAFPMQEPQAIHSYAAAAVADIPYTEVGKRDAEYLKARGEAVGGMSLRDYFAAHEPIPADGSISLRLAERLVGRPHPSPKNALGELMSGADPLELAHFWADAEAKYRYLRADAMLRAREGGAA